MIIRKSIFRIAALGVFIFIGVAVVTGFIFFREQTDKYSDLAYSFSEIACVQVSPDKLEKLLERPDVIDFLDTALISDSLSEEDQELADFWSKTNILLYEAMRSVEPMKNFQIVVPYGEDDKEVVQIWGLSKDPDAYESRYRPYNEGEKEIFEKLSAYDAATWFLNAETGDHELSFHSDDGETVGSAIYPIYDSNGGEILAFAEVDISITNIWFSIVKLLLSILGIVLIIMIIGIRFYFSKMKKEIISPILLLEKASSGAVEKLRDGNRAFELNIRTGDEIEELSHSFERMEESLLAYIEENESITSERERLKTELNLATMIQADMLPSVFPAFPEHKEFDIYASMLPAKEVGGDFYDYFLVDDDTLALVIADVSGKGVPASLFMMRSMLLIETVTKSNPNPAEVLTEVNIQLCNNNKSGMFVTVWLGLLNLKTGLLRVSNAGHEYPIIRQPGGPYELYKDAHSFVLGGMERMKLKEYEIQLQPGAALYLYTDGATEAKNADNKMVQIDGFVDIVNRAADDSPETKVKAVGQEIMDFIGEAEQFDDLTMLCLFYFGGTDESMPSPGCSVR